MSNQVSITASKKSCVTQILDDEDININNISEGEEDHISKLPDGVVGHILCLLPIKDALRTSVLSRDWEYKWTSMCDIEIDDKHKSLFGEAKVACFINFVTRILMRTCNSRIRTFYLSCEQNYPIDYLETWISWVLMRNVKDLKVVAYGIQRLDSRWCFSGWTSLTGLELKLSCTLVFPSDGQFPNLRRLCLINTGLPGSIKLKTEQISIAGRIVLKFPALRGLILCQCEWVGVNCVEIHAPEMVCFQTSCFEEIKNYEIKIFGTKLSRFESMHGSINNIDLHAPAISHADVYHTSFARKEHQVNKTLLLTRTHKVLTQFPHLTCLKLSGEIVQALVPSSEYGLVFPTFDRVKEFHLGRCYLKNTLNVLRALPLLESLTLSTYFWACTTERGEPWPPEILSNLKKVKLKDSWGSDMEFDFSNFILENAENLQEMLILLGRLGQATEVVTCRLSKIKPKSPSCRLVVNKLIL